LGESGFRIVFWSLKKSLTDAPPGERLGVIRELTHRAPAGFPPAGRLSFYANLSTMLPHRPHAYDAGLDAEISHSGAAPVSAGLSGSDQAQVDHHSRICPNCDHRLTGHRCKLVCTECGYYLSCADYY
jgi:hypothetical protein